jgi:starch synthase
MKILYASAEAWPIAKTGGLGDVGASLPRAYAELGADVRLVVPAYRGAFDHLRETWRVADLQVRGQAFAIWQGKLRDSGVDVWLVDAPPLYARDGDPYRDRHGRLWGDLAWRFGCFSEVIARLALGEGVGWRCDALHLNDWHTALAAVHLRRRVRRPRSIFTIHNLAYQGVYGRSEFDALGLPADLWHVDALEFHGGWSFMKAGILYSDAVTTVSPTYAREIQRPEHGEGLDGLLRSRAHALSGVVNGIDTRTWDPATDPHLAARYDAASVTEGKRANKAALQSQLGLDRSDGMLVGIIARLVHQKGIDAVLAAAPELDRLPIQLAILGSGDADLERALVDWAKASPGRVVVRIGHDEALAHRIEAGADAFLMPSRYEPCGMNQMFSQRYGTIPVVRRVGGLADTVVDATGPDCAPGSATGIHFEHADAGGVLFGVRQALGLFRHPPTWIAMMRAGMAKELSWSETAHRYLTLGSAGSSEEVPKTARRALLA